MRYIMGGGEGAIEIQKCIQLDDHVGLDVNPGM